MNDEIIEQINNSVKWLAENPRSNNVVKIVKVIDNLSISAMTLGEQVAEAYRVMNEAEDTYKIAVSKYVAKSQSGVAKAEREAEAKYANLKTQWTTAKNIYKRFDTILDRIDKICDSHRQRISVLKQTEMKGL